MDASSSSSIQGAMYPTCGEVSVLNSFCTPLAPVDPKFGMPAAEALRFDRAFA